MPHKLLSKHCGQCHCGAVKFEVEYAGTARVHECNCSICGLCGFQHLIVPNKQFRLITGEDNLTIYTFNTGAAKHSFCSICGIKPFYVPRSNPDGYSVNFRCLDASEFTRVIMEPFDGQNWEQHAESLARLSRTENWKAV
jgi:hypothetical protein